MNNSFREFLGVDNVATKNNAEHKKDLQQSDSKQQLTEVLTAYKNEYRRLRLNAATCSTTIDEINQKLLNTPPEEIDYKYLFTLLAKANNLTSNAKIVLETNNKQITGTAKCNGVTSQEKPIIITDPKAISDLLDSVASSGV